MPRLRLRRELADAHSCSMGYNSNKHVFVLFVLVLRDMPDLYQRRIISVSYIRSFTLSAHHVASSSSRQPFSWFLLISANVLWAEIVFAVARGIVDREFDPPKSDFDFHKLLLCISHPDQQGVRGESNPPPRPSQGRMQNRYTTDTISSPGWIRTSDLSHVTGMSCPLNDGTGKYPDQDSNPERLVRSEE